MNDVLGAALKDFLQKKRRQKLWIHNKYGSKEEMPVATYFRTVENISSLELLALQGCTGNILDVGAAAGCHSLILQNRRLSVTALDISPGACAVMKERGVKKIINADIFTYHKKQFDTILFLMNGIGVAGTLTRLQQLLQSFQQVIKPGSHILFDSSDVQYLYQQQLPEHYYGEIDYCYEYKNQFSDWFKWLYVDKTSMLKIAMQEGFEFEVLTEDESGQYLGRLRKLMVQTA